MKMNVPTCLTSLRAFCDATAAGFLFLCFCFVVGLGWLCGLRSLSRDLDEANAEGDE